MTTATNRSGQAVTGWQVTSQQEVTDLGPSGQFVSGYKISFSLATGQTGSVFVPRSAYSPENVRRVIQAWATRVAAVGGMTG